MISVNNFVYVVICFFYVTSLFAAVEPEALRHMITTEMHKRLSETLPDLVPATIGIDVQNVAAVLGRHPEAMSAEMDWSGGRQSLLGRTVVPIRLLDSKAQVLGRYGVVVVVSAQAPVIETVGHLLRGAEIGSSDIRLVLRDAQSQPALAVRDTKKVIGLELMTPVADGVVLTESMLRPVPDIRRGSLVTVFLTRSGIRVGVRGEVLSDVQIGQRAQVRLQIGLRRVLEGQVVDSETVYAE